GDGLFPRQHAGDHHDRRADDGHAGPVDAQPREPAEREPEIRADERDQRDESHPGEFGHAAEYTGRHPSLRHTPSDRRYGPLRSLEPIERDSDQKLTRTYVF